MLDYRFPSVHIRDTAERPHVATPYLRTHTEGRAHMSRTDRDFASAHVKSLYERSIVGRIMNRYVQCSSHLFSYPATGAVTCVHTQLRATVTRTMPSIDPSSSKESKRSAKSLHVCTTQPRHFAVKLHCLLADAVRFISTEKRKGARKTFTCAIYARGARRQRYSEERRAWARRRGHLAAR